MCSSVTFARAATVRDACPPGAWLRLRAHCGQKHAGAEWREMRASRTTEAVQQGDGGARTRTGEAPRPLARTASRASADARRACGESNREASQAASQRPPFQASPSFPSLICPVPSPSPLRQSAVESGTYAIHPDPSGGRPSRGLPAALRPAPFALTRRFREQESIS